MRKDLILFIVLSVFLAGASLAQEQGKPDDENVPLTDGLSPVLHGVITKIDSSAGSIIIGQQSYRLVPNQNEILARIVGEAERGLVDNVDLGKLRAGDRIRYAVDEMGMGDGSVELFVLGVMK